MAYDDDWKKYMQPDLQGQLPEWMPMGEQEAPNVSPFVDGLKKRMSQRKSTGGPFDAQPEMSYSEMLGSGGTKKGGMQSL